MYTCIYIYIYIHPYLYTYTCTCLVLKQQRARLFSSGEAHHFQEQLQKEDVLAEQLDR